MDDVTTKDVLQLILLVALGLAVVAAVAAGYTYGSPWFGALILVMGCVVIGRSVVRTVRKLSS
jgi:fatty acid desaturase